MAKNKTRLDVALVEKGLAESREKAKAIIEEMKHCEEADGNR